jgi:hypothetical protein
MPPGKRNRRSNHKRISSTTTAPTACGRQATPSPRWTKHDCLSPGSEPMEKARGSNFREPPPFYRQEARRVDSSRADVSPGPMLSRLFATTLTAHEGSQGCASGHPPVGSDPLIYRQVPELNSWSATILGEFPWNQQQNVAGWTGDHSVFSQVARNVLLHHASNSNFAVNAFAVLFCCEDHHVYSRTYSAHHCVDDATRVCPCVAA